MPCDIRIWQERREEGSTASASSSRSSSSADHFHDTPAFEGRKCMLAAGMIDDDENDLFLGGFRGELFQGRSHL
jgi:hypothetical protein